MSTRGVVTSGHYLASAAGYRILLQGGNAIDAAVSMGLCLALLEPQSNGLGGEVPTLVYSAQDRKPYAISGMGWSPAAFTIGWCRQNSIDLIPGDGYLPACVPAMMDTYCLALARFGTKTFAEVAAPAVELAADGFPVYNGLHNFLVSQQKRFTELYPSTGKVFLPGGRAPEVGEVLRNPDWAWVLQEMSRAEAACSKGRVAAIEAARDVFYKGKVAEKIVEFITAHPVVDASGKAHAGMLTLADMAEWQAAVEEPVTYNYRGLDVFKCSSWTQGPVFLQQLALLEGYNLAEMSHNSADYLHTLIECAKLAFADREAYYGDPAFDAVPFDVLLSKEYAANRRKLVGEGASPDMRPGDVGLGFPEYATRPVLEDNRLALAAPNHTGDTTHLDAIDAQGNMIACTPSGGWIQSSPVIDGLGFPLGTRGQMFYLNADRPNALAPHKRPRATLTPSLATRDGEPYMVFGTPGGDSQDQWTLQFFLNYVDFGMSIQEALDAPTVHSDHFPSSFYPRQGFPQAVSAENRLAPDVLQELERRGHKITLVDGWVHGKVMGIRFDVGRGVILGGVAPKGDIGYAIGW
jgi:gamma-glutamyltranspeptidase/glutathione hydrolase